MWTIGQPCQAIDEEGVWADAKIMKVMEEGRWKVPFKGYGHEFDVECDEEALRRRLPPFSQQRRCIYISTIYISKFV